MNDRLFTTPCEKDSTGYVKTDSKGHFKVRIRAQMKGYTLTVFAEDPSGNKSKNRGIKVY
ncbi:Ig-like domain-containing protein [Bacillus salipaludis]|uniref:Ig-like domain-containing protein n=1 Tax=Bacillus salipaludis TaxID=2547811 RepID=UPI003D23C6D2